MPGLRRLEVQEWARVLGVDRKLFDAQVLGHLLVAPGAGRHLGGDLSAALDGHAQQRVLGELRRPTEVRPVGVEVVRVA